MDLRTFVIFYAIGTNEIHFLSNGIATNKVKLQIKFGQTIYLEVISENLLLRCQTLVKTIYEEVANMLSQN